jgi:hypothetical protein
MHFFVYNEEMREIQAVMKVKAETKAAHIEKRNAALKSADIPAIRELI